MKKLLVAILGGVIYFVDESGRLCSMRENSVEIECDEPMEISGICAGVGGCGNYRIFITDAKDSSLKVFDPLNRRLTTLASLQKVPLSLAKEECTLVIAVEGEILTFDLKELKISGRFKL